MKASFMLVGATLGCATFVGGTLLLAACQEQRSDADKERLQGTWQVTALVEGGKAVPPESLKETRMTIKGNQFTFKGDQSYRGAFTLEPGKKPKWIDTTFMDEDSKEAGRALGIYELTGDQLKITWRHKGKDRPADFVSKDEGVRSIVLKRAR
jgi:uncharacterized protein (TIGR03067 family)